MHITRRTFIQTSAALGAIGALGALSAPAIAQGGIFNYKVGTNVQASHSLYIRLTEASEAIRKDTGGKVNIRIFPNGQLGSDTDMVSQVRSGAIDMLTTPGVVLANLVPMASLNSVGFIFPDYPSVWKAMDGNLGNYMRSHIAKTGLVVTDKIFDNGFRHVTSQKPVNIPADLAGMKIRVPVSPLLLSLFKSLGAASTPINFNELYGALQTKVVEGQENPLTLIANSKLYEVQKNCAMTGHTWDGYWMVANKRSMEALPAPMRAIVNQHMDAAAMAQRADSEKLAVSLQTDLAAKGMVFTRPDPAPFRKALQQANFYQEWKSKFGDEAWAQLEAAVGKLV